MKTNNKSKYPKPVSIVDLLVRNVDPESVQNDTHKTNIDDKKKPRTPEKVKDIISAIQEL